MSIYDFSLSGYKQYGSYAQNGVDFLVLQSVSLRDKDAIAVDIQPDSGFDITRIITPHREFLRRRVPMKVAAGASIRAAYGTLAESLKVLPAWNSTTLPGYDPKTGLHSGLSGLSPIGDRWESFSVPREGLGVKAEYYITTGITGAPFSQSAIVERRVSLYPVTRCLSDDDGTVVIQRNDTFCMRTGGFFGHLEHPNVILKPDDVIRYPINGVSGPFDRDGITPEGQNPFKNYDPKVFGTAVPERCFFLWIPPDKNDYVNVLLFNKKTQTGLGFRSQYDKKFPSWVMIWSSPKSDESEEGVGSVEFGTLPLGATRAYELGLLPHFSAEKAFKRITEILVLDTLEKTLWFAEQLNIELDDKEYPGLILPDHDGNFVDYNPATAKFDTLRRAAGIIS